MIPDHSFMNLPPQGRSDIPHSRLLTMTLKLHTHDLRHQFTNGSARSLLNHFDNPKTNMNLQKVQK